MRPWSDGAFDRGGFFALAAFALAAGVMTAIGSEFLRGIRTMAKEREQNFFAATLLLVRGNTRHYGGYAVHLGVALVVVGLAGATFNRSVESEMALKDTVSIGSYTLQCAGSTEDSNANYDSEYALLNVSKNGKPPFQMPPEKRLYHASEQPQTMVAIHSTPAGDLYVIYEGMNSTTGQPVIKALLNPLVGWIWGGVLLMFIGALMALVPRTVDSSKDSGGF